MDIKDLILIVGGLLIAGVMAHGFWIAWRAKREPLRMEIVPDLIPEPLDEMEVLRSELPNGGSRPVNERLGDAVARGREPRQAQRNREAPEQTALDLDEQLPVLLEPASTQSSTAADTRPPPATPRRRREPVLDAPETTERKANDRGQRRAATAKTSYQTKPSPRAAADDIDPPTGRAATQASPAEEPQSSDSAASAGPRRSRVADVTLPPTDEAGRAARRRRGDAAAGGSTTGVERRRSSSGPYYGRERRGAARAGADGAPSQPSTPVPNDLIMLHVIAHATFRGKDLTQALRNRGLRYGEMGIFHRIDPLTKARQFSVANIVEPGSFNLKNLGGFTSPGIVFFMQLPGPENPQTALEDMLRVAQKIADQLGGDVLDHARSPLTAATTELYRQRAVDVAQSQTARGA